MKKPEEVQGLKTKGTPARSLYLWLVLLLVFLAYLFVLVPPFNQTPLRIIFAVPIILFLPGYALTAVMFRRREDLNGIERFTLNIGLSIAAFVFDGFAISVTLWRFRPTSIILSLALITLTLAMITFLARRRIRVEERENSNSSKFLVPLRTEEKSSEIERALIIALLCLIIIVSGVRVYAKITFEEEPFTALYILGEGGKTENYPREVYLLEPSSMIVVIENHEHATTNYTLQVILGPYTLHNQQIMLAHGEKWNETVFFTPKHIAKQGKLDFLLYKEDTTNPYRSVHFWVDSVIDYTDLAKIRGYALSDLPTIKNPDMESQSNWTFTENARYFRGHFTKFYRTSENATVGGWITDNRKGEEIANARVSNLYEYANSTYQIEYPYPKQTAQEKGRYGGIYQDVVSGAGVATLSFKVRDTENTNRREGCMYKQVLLNELVVWEDDVAGDEGWQEVKTPITLDNGTNRLMLQVYAKQGSKGFPVSVWWDEVRIARFEEQVKEIATPFYIRNANGTREYYPTELHLGEPEEVLVGIGNREQEPVNYTMQIKLAGELLETEWINQEEYSKGGQKLAFTPNQIGQELKLEFLLFKDIICEEPCGALHFWASSDIDYDNLEVLNEYVVSPLPEIVNGDMESETAAGWKIEKSRNFTVEITDSDFVSPMHSYELCYPAETPFERGCYAGISQDVTTETCPATVAVSFNVRESYTPDKDGYFVKQVLLNEEVIWEDDVAGNERWEHIIVPVTLRSATNKLTLRAYGTRGSDNYPINVWWDDVTIEPVTAVGEELGTYFYIRDTKGTEEEYPTELYLGEPAAVRVGIENNEHKDENYLLQMKLEGELLKTKSKWLKHGSKWAQNISFTSDRVGEKQKLEFLLFKDYVKEKPYRYCHLWVSTAINYDNLEQLLRYGIEPLPRIRDGDMSQIHAWTSEPEYRAAFKEGHHREEYTSAPCSYCIRQYIESTKGDYMGLSQDIYAREPGVVVLSFNVRDSYEESSDAAKKIIKQVVLNDKVIWADDVSGEDAGYVGWVKEEYVGPNWVWIEHIKSHERFLGWKGAGYDWWEDDWIKRSVPAVKSGWMHVDIPVYLREGKNEGKLQVYAKEAVEYLDVQVYWDDVEIRQLTELVKVDERVRMKRYR